MTDLSGRTCAVTGANSGIGYETVRFWIDAREAACRFRGEAPEDALFALCANMTGIHG